MIKVLQVGKERGRKFDSLVIHRWGSKGLSGAFSWERLVWLRNMRPVLEPLPFPFRGGITAPSGGGGGERMHRDMGDDGEGNAPRWCPTRYLSGRTPTEAYWVSWWVRKGEGEGGSL